MPLVARLLLAFLVAAAPSCSRPSGPPASGSGPGPERTVTGFITEIEFRRLSLRTVDGRSLIFSLADPPVPEKRLREDMAGRSPIRITYRAQSGKLIPLRIEHPCPGPDCPAPYSNPPPSRL